MQLARALLQQQWERTAGSTKQQATTQWQWKGAAGWEHEQQMSPCVLAQGGVKTHARGSDALP